MATNRMSGNLLGVKIAGDYISCETSCEVAFETDLLPSAAVVSGRWKEYISGVRSWNVSVNAGMLIRMLSDSGLPAILNAFITGDLIAVSIETKWQDEYPSFVVSGNVRLRNGGFSAAVNSLASWNATLEGDGPMTYNIETPVIYDTIFYGSTSVEPTTEAQVEALFNGVFTTNPLILDTDLALKYHTIVIPSDRNLVSVYNITAEEDVYSEYIPSNIIYINGVEFKRYTMETVVPYITNNQHQFILE